jgi:hypothetical protein
LLRASVPPFALGDDVIGVAPERQASPLSSALFAEDDRAQQIGTHLLMLAPIASRLARLAAVVPAPRHR